MYGNVDVGAIPTMGAIGMAATKAAQAPCDGAVDRAIRGQEETLMLLDQMESRLVPVLRDSESGNSTGAPEECPQSPLHRHLLNIGNASDRINTRINDLIARLTV